MATPTILHPAVKTEHFWNGRSAFSRPMVTEIVFSLTEKVLMNHPLLDNFELVLLSHGVDAIVLGFSRFASAF